MKQNTKFLWMYIAILFSFAIILILFAGLSRNTSNEQQQGMKDNIATLSQKNTELTNKIKELETTLESVNAKSESLISDKEMHDSNEKILGEANICLSQKKYSQCASLIKTIDINALTNSQTYLYYSIIENDKVREYIN